MMGTATAIRLRAEALFVAHGITGKAVLPDSGAAVPGPAPAHSGPQRLGMRPSCSPIRRNAPAPAARSFRAPVAIRVAARATRWGASAVLARESSFRVIGDSIKTLCDSLRWLRREHEIPYVGCDVKQVITTVVYVAGLPYGQLRQSHSAEGFESL